MKLIKLIFFKACTFLTILNFMLFSFSSDGQKFSNLIWHCNKKGINHI
jgi:hypothetical protein